MVEKRPVIPCPLNIKRCFLACQLRMEDHLQLPAPGAHAAMSLIDDENHEAIPLIFSFLADRRVLLVDDALSAFISSRSLAEASELLSENEGYEIKNETVNWLLRETAAFDGAATPWEYILNDEAGCEISMRLIDHDLRLRDAAMTPKVFILIAKPATAQTALNVLALGFEVSDEVAQSLLEGSPSPFAKLILDGACVELVSALSAKSSTLDAWKTSPELLLAAVNQEKVDVALRLLEDGVQVSEAIAQALLAEMSCGQSEMLALSFEDVLSTVNFKELESPHPYSSVRVNEETLVRIRGAKAVAVAFDPRSETTDSYAAVSIRSTNGGGSDEGDNESDDGDDDGDKESKTYWGKTEWWHRRNWPGVGDEPALRVDSDSFIVNFKSDGDSPKWGWRLVAWVLEYYPGWTSLHSLTIFSSEQSRLLASKLADANESIKAKLYSPEMSLSAATCGDMDSLVYLMERAHAAGKTVASPEVFSLIAKPATAQTALNVLALGFEVSDEVAQSLLEGSPSPFAKLILDGACVELVSALSAKSSTLDAWKTSPELLLAAVNQEKVDVALRLLEDGVQVSEAIAQALLAEMSCGQSEMLALSFEDVLSTVNFKELESPHPYSSVRVNEETLVRIRGAKAVAVAFDPRSETTDSYAAVSIRSTNGGGSDEGDNESDDGDDDGDKESKTYWGKTEWWHRRNWPGVGDEPALRVDSDSFIVNFKSDGDSPKWGWRLVAWVLEYYPGWTSLHSLTIFSSEQSRLLASKLADANESIKAKLYSPEMGLSAATCGDVDSLVYLMERGLVTDVT